MGVHPLITIDTFPEQSDVVGTMIDVTFASGDVVKGLVVRDDVNYPRLNRRIVQLNDDRYLLIQTTDTDEVRNSPERETRPLDESGSAVFANGGYPAQGTWRMRRTEVIFNYNTSKRVTGTIVRDDSHAPYETIIALDDGRWILDGECQHNPQGR